jgi:hypothetical protein
MAALRGLDPKPSAPTKPLISGNVSKKQEPDVNNA